jgi:acyl carrier protein
MAELMRLRLLPASVVTVNLAGEALAPKLVSQVYAQSTVERLYNLYGPSEDTTYSTYALMSREPETTPVIGRPLANTQVYLLDRELQPVPVGVAAELYLGGDGLARGYLNRPDLTAEKFVPDPFGQRAGGRLYRTGDLARYLPDGQLDYLGRLDHQIKLRGFRIELGDIEAALGRHASVREVVVMVREDGGGEKRLVAYLTTNGRADAPEASQLRQYLKEKLPDYMIPNWFVVLEEMPLTPNGKINRKALPAPEQRREAGAENDFVAPRTATEESVAQIWREVLGVAEVSVTDNFFALGGHSLLATQALAKLCESIHLELPLRVVFESPTVAELAAAIDRLKENAATQSAPEIIPYSRERFRVQTHVRTTVLDATETLKEQQV